MNNTPLVSIVMPVYNTEQYLATAINAVIEQSYTNWELIIIDDGSVDNSLAIAKKFESEKIHVYNILNSGAAAARNFGYKKAKGTFIKFFDADDIINTEMIAEQVSLALINPDCIISGKWGRFYKNDLTTFELKPEECWKDMNGIDWICSSWLNGSMTQPGIFLIPNQIIKKAGLWDETLSLIDDLEYFTKTILASKKVVFCKGAILYYRSGNSNNLSGLKSKKALDSYFRSMLLSTGYLLKSSDSNKAKLSAANVWQAFIYECYPKQKKECKIAENRIKELGGSTLVYPAGGISKFIAKYLNWKVVNHIKKLINK